MFIAGYQGGHEAVPLELMGIGAAPEALRSLSLEADDGLVVALEADRPLGAEGVMGETSPTAGDLAAFAETAHAAGVGELDRMMIEDFADARGDADLAPAHADGLNRCLAGEPVANINPMHVLFDNVIATEPDEMIPVVDLVMHLAHAGTAGAAPDVADVKEGAGVTEIAEETVMNLSNGLEMIGGVAQVMPNGNAQPLSPGLLVGGFDLAIAGGIDRHRFFHKDVFAGFDRVFELLRTKARRGAEEDDMNIGLERLLVGVKTGKALVAGHIDLAGESRVERFQAAVEVLRESVGHGHQFHVGVDGIGEGVGGGAGAASTAADQCDADFITARGMGEAADVEAGGRHHGEGGGGFLEKIAPGGRGRDRRLLTFHETDVYAVAASCREQNRLGLIVTDVTHIGETGIVHRLAAPPGSPGAPPDLD
jgi:hypothetical protein